MSFAFSRDARVLAAADDDGIVTLLGDEATTVLGALETGARSPQLAWLVTGELVVADGDSGALSVWDTRPLLGERVLSDAPHRTLAEVLSAAPTPT